MSAKDPGRAHATRRRFLATAAGATTASGLMARAGVYAVSPTRASRSHNDAITLGFIGVGGMGSGLLNIFQRFDDVRVAAVCDIDESRALRAREAAGGKPDVYADFRRVLDRDDIDAVVIATPDHWHAIPTILACQAGKDIYCEKPLAYRIGEGRRIVDAVTKYDRVTQMGNLIHATDNYHRIAEIVQSGALGTVRKARFWMAQGGGGLGHPADSTPPAGVDYDTWLGPAPARPFNPNRFHFNWRFYWDYAGGMFADFVCHLVDPIHWGLQARAPESAVATGGRYVLDDNAETPDTMEAVFHYPGKSDDDPGWDLVWSLQTGNPHGFHGRGAGVEFVGTRGTLHGHYSDYVILPNRGEAIEEPEPFLPRSQGHHREWLDKIRTREICSCNFEYGHQMTNVAHLGNIALRTGQMLRWDADRERVTNSEEANRYLLREEYRAPWRLPDV